MFTAFFHFLVSHGSLGMFISALLAGSVFPFNSEMVMAALQAGGANPVGLLIWGTLGNVLGGIFNFWVGSLGKQEWIEKYLHVSREKMEKAQRFVARYGSWMGLLAWIPLLGSAITVALGYMRANPYLSILCIFIGKFLRYLLVVYAVASI